MIGYCRSEWEVLEAVIGQVDEPFQVTLLYTSCVWQEGATLAVDSLEFRDCDLGEFNDQTVCKLIYAVYIDTVFYYSVVWLIFSRGGC